VIVAGEERAPDCVGEVRWAAHVHAGLMSFVNVVPA
jgi:hypothetical protein